MSSCCLLCLFVFVLILEKLGRRAIDIILKQRMVVFSGFCTFAHFIYLSSQALLIWNFSSPAVILMNPFHFLQSITCCLLIFWFVCMSFKNWPGLDLCEAVCFSAALCPSWEVFFLSLWLQLNIWKLFECLECPLESFSLLHLMPLSPASFLWVFQVYLHLFDYPELWNDIVTLTECSYQFSFHQLCFSSWSELGPEWKFP